jgi:5-methylcytosine-specific restriction endonuclease McrA
MDSRDRIARPGTKAPASPSQNRGQPIQLQDFNDIEIDHIIPKHLGPECLKELKDKYGLPEDFDIDAPQNLAPICSVCNGPRGKGKGSV